MNDQSIANLPLAQFVEVYEATSYKRANVLLANGYTLLHIDNGARAQVMPGDPVQRTHFVKRFPIFVLGRTADVARFEFAENGAEAAAR